MAPIVQLWSGREVRFLREAKRMSIRAFAAHLGVSERMVSKWEAGAGSIQPRPINQSALDSSLASSSADVQARFTWLISTLHPPPRRPAESTDPAPLPLNEPHQVRHPVDGKLMALVEGGTFLRGPDNVSVFVPEFYIDVFPTTNADYARFTAVAGHPTPRHWSRQAVPPDDLQDHPVVFVTWHDAAAYATWAGKELPTALQWEKAARGPRGDIYPWGDQLTPAKCNVRESDIRATTPVDRYHSGASPYGVYDLCGNTWEWCASPTDADRYELKGSAFTSPFYRAAPSAFNDAAATMRDDDTGFRCVTPAETLRGLLEMTR